VIYRGRVPSNINKDAGYSVVHAGHGQMQVRLIYRLGRGEKALITTSAHPSLVRMVNDAKSENGGAPGGIFYINEYGHVVVPTGNSCHFAGTYGRLLEFEFEGRVITPKAPDGLLPGDVWPGPRVGIAYTLCADGADIKYEGPVPGRANVIKECRLSLEHGRSAAGNLAHRLGRHKPGGGRIYINEAKEFFTPAERGGEWVHLYLGSLGNDEWFSPPPII